MSLNTKILKPEGILDSNKSISLREQVQESLKEGDNLIAIDFEKVTFMDSTGLGTLIMIRRMIVEEGNGQLFLMSLNDQVKMLLFELTNTGQFFDIVADKTELPESS